MRGSQTVAHATKSKLHAAEIRLTGVYMSTVMSRHALQLCLAVGFGSEMTSVNSHSAYSFESRQARMEVIDFCPSTCNDALKCIGP